MNKEGLTFGKVVREYFPKATDEEVDFILWEKTGFPCFWKTADTEACLRKQLQELKDYMVKVQEQGKVGN